MLRFLLGLLLTLWAGIAHADDLRPGYLEIREIQHFHYAVNWKAPAKAVHVAPVFPSDCSVTVPPQRIFEAAAVLSRWTIACKVGLEGRKIKLDGLNSTQGDALLRYQPLSGAVQVARLTPALPYAQIIAHVGRMQVARIYFVTGVEHILAGYDHLLFVLSLVLLLNGGWRIAATVTAFTVAHSITLVATTLEWIAVPRAPVETVIALSIVFLAVEIVKRRPPHPRLSERYPWIVAFAFGLLHGFGFAGALAEIGLPQAEMPTALLMFNLGVEAGQLLIVIAALATLAVVRKSSAGALRPVQTAAAYGIGSIAVMWLIERISGV